MPSFGRVYRSIDFDRGRLRQASPPKKATWSARTMQHRSQTPSRDEIESVLQAIDTTPGHGQPDDGHQGRV